MRDRLGFSLFAAAVAASAAAHAALFVSFRAIRVGTGGIPAYAEIVVLSDPSDPPAPEPDEFDIGEPDAKGYATHDAAGRHEQQAREAPQDQASLSLDPVGTSRVVEVPSAPGDEARRMPPTNLAPPPALTAATLPPVPLEPILPNDVEQPERDRISGVALVPAAPRVEPVRLEIALAPLPAPSVPPTPTAAAGTAGSGADPAPKSESESDAFSVLGTAQFRAGRVSVQSGRRVKTRRPRVGLAGMVELAKRNTAEVVLKVSVDPGGNVTNVDVARSSGSNEIDQPCRVAMYDWRFEPKKDPSGRAVPDVFRFTISFR